MVILIVSTYYWPRPGAASIRLAALAQAFASDGHKIIIITNNGYPAYTTGPAGETILHVRASSKSGVSLYRAFRLVKYAIFVFLRTRRIKPDVIISDPPPTSAIAAFTATKAQKAYYFADSWYEMLKDAGTWSSKFLSWLVKPLELAALRSANETFCVQPHLQQLAQSFGARHTHLTPNGTDTATFTDRGPKWQDPWNGQIPYFLYAGNYGVPQGATVFLDAARIAWAQGVSFGLVFMGYGADEKLLQQFAIENPSSFASFPLQDPEIAASAFRGARAALVSLRPTLVNIETKPTKSFAALASGCPVIFAGDSQFAQEIQDSDLGLGVAWRPGAVAKAMLHAVHPPNKADSISTAEYRANVRRYAVEHYDNRQSIDRIKQIMLTTLHGQTRV